MLPTINLTSNRDFLIRNFEEDKIATLSANKGLRYQSYLNGSFTLRGNFCLTDSSGGLIESFEIEIQVSKDYPNFFPILLLLDDKVEKLDEFHINKEGLVCLEHTYIANKLASAGLRVYDFVHYYLPKYFSWVLVKKYGKAQNLQEWGHGNDGTIQFYETLLGTSNKSIIRFFLEKYSKTMKIKRNDNCYCGNGKKLKYCHLEAVEYLRATSKESITKDIILFQ